MANKYQDKARGRKSKGQTGSVRIIGGRLRGSKLPVLDRKGLRPTGDRAREVLFNWLAPSIHGMNVLDLFAGTGALGLEAISRGAGAATLVEKDPIVAAAIAQSVQRLLADDADQVRVLNSDALAMTPGGERFDLIFVDPPFDMDLFRTSLSLAEARLKPNGQVYLETPSQADLSIDRCWWVSKEKIVGDVRLQLLQLTRSE